MTTITITLSDERLHQLKEIAKHFHVEPEEFVRVSVEELLKKPEEDFRRALEHVLKKNSELYRRLAMVESHL